LTSTPGPTAAKPRLYYGWWLVIGGFAVQNLQSSLLFLSQGAYLIELQAAFGWSRSAISGAFSLVRLESGVLGPLQGWMIDRFGARPVMLVGTLLFGVGFILLGRIQNLWQFYVAFGVIAMGSGLGGFLTIHTAIAQWFVRKRARAMSVTSIGFATGALVAPIVAWSLVTQGWRETSFISGVVILLVGLPAAQLFRSTPEAHGLLPDGDTVEEARLARERAAVRAHAPEINEGDFTVREAMRDRSFWFVSLGHGMALLVTSTVPVHMVPYLVDQNAWSPAATALVFPGIMVMQIAGQITGGLLGDLYNKRFVAAGAMVGHGLAFIVLAISPSVTAVIATIVLHGFSWGARGPLMMAIRADFYGRRNLGLISGWSNSITLMGSVIGPVYAGVLFDQLGSYNVAFWTLGVATAASTVFFLAARKPPLPARLLDPALFG
jgi:MFS family permease